MAKVFDSVVFSQPYVTQILWPKHCVMNSWGAEFHKDLLILPSAHRVINLFHIGETNVGNCAEYLIGLSMQILIL